MDFTEEKEYWNSKLTVNQQYMVKHLTYKNDYRNSKAFGYFCNNATDNELSQNLLDYASEFAKRFDKTRKLNSFLFIDLLQFENFCINYGGENMNLSFSALKEDIINGNRKTIDTLENLFYSGFNDVEYLIAVIKPLPLLINTEQLLRLIINFKFTNYYSYGL